MDYAIYRANKQVGTVRDGPGGIEVDGDDELKAAVTAVLSQPPSEMFGGETPGGVLWDGVRTFEPGTPGHVRAALTSGALVRYGYIGAEADQK